MLYHCTYPLLLGCDYLGSEHWQPEALCEVNTAFGWVSVRSDVPHKPTWLLLASLVAHHMDSVGAVRVLVNHKPTLKIKPSEA